MPIHRRRVRAESTMRQTAFPPIFNQDGALVDLPCHWISFTHEINSYRNVDDSTETFINSLYMLLTYHNSGKEIAQQMESNSVVYGGKTYSDYLETKTYETY